MFTQWFVIIEEFTNEGAFSCTVCSDECYKIAVTFCTKVMGYFSDAFFDDIE